MEQENKWMVYVSCMTFNHAPYIVDALNGFTMQETTFPYVCAVIDDASTDREQEVIKNYLQEHFDLEDTSIVRNEETDDYVLTFARHKSNKNCHFAVLYLKYNHYSIKKSKAPYISEWQDNSKYIAICEGDDYWIDKSKLQRQVTKMEGNNNFSAVAENGIIIDVRTKKEVPFSMEKERNIGVEALIEKRRFPTASVLYRKSVICADYYEMKFHYDTITWCYLASKGVLRYYENVSSVYRRGCGITCMTDSYEWATLIEKWDLELIRVFTPHFVSPSMIKEKIFEQYRIAFQKSNNLDKMFGSIKKMFEYGNPLNVIYSLFIYNHFVWIIYKKFRKLLDHE